MFGLFNSKAKYEPIIIELENKISELKAEILLQDTQLKHLRNELFASGVNERMRNESLASAANEREPIAYTGITRELRLEPTGRVGSRAPYPQVSPAVATSSRNDVAKTRSSGNTATYDNSHVVLDNSDYSSSSSCDSSSSSCCDSGGGSCGD